MYSTYIIYVIFSPATPCHYIVRVFILIYMMTELLSGRIARGEGGETGRGGGLEGDGKVYLCRKIILENVPHHSRFKEQEISSQS